MPYFCIVNRLSKFWKYPHRKRNQKSQCIEANLFTYLQFPLIKKWIELPWFQVFVSESFFTSTPKSFQFLFLCVLIFKIFKMSHHVISPRTTFPKFEKTFYNRCLLTKIYPMCSDTKHYKFKRALNSMATLHNAGEGKHWANLRYKECN